MRRDPESLLGTEDGEAYRRFVEWSVGDGFDLAIIKMTAPVDRKTLIAWTQEQVPGAREIDLKMVGPEQSRLWDLLLAARDEQQATMLLVHGLEESPGRQRILAQLNVERDELVKAFAMPWVLFVHPATYSALVDKAPDFVDFAGLWLEEVARPNDGAMVLEAASIQEEIVVDTGEESETTGDLLHEAAVAIRFAQLDKARDLLARYEFRQVAGVEEDLDGTLARCLRAFVDNRRDEALLLLSEKLLPRWERLAARHLQTIFHLVDILRFRGAWDEALDLARNYLLPTFERRGDSGARAATLGKVASILEARGELDEALRIYREEELPVYEELGDIRARAMTLGSVADILVKRGELDEALRIYREEELPVYERLGDSRARAVTLGNVADILATRGESDEALRIYREEELPVYERLGDARARAVTLNKIADILSKLGKANEALRIYREETLPAFERLGDVRSQAVTLGRVANIHRTHGKLDEALRIYREQQWPVYERLGDRRLLLAGRLNVAATLLQRGRIEDREEIEKLLGLALQDARLLRISEVKTIERIIRKTGGDPNAPPYV